MSERNEARIRAAKPQEKPYKQRDGRGLHLLITPSGGRLWRFRYRYAGRESMVSLGACPDVPLKDARERREEARRALAASIDPAAQRKAERAGLEDAFEAIALEWLAKQQFATATRKKAEWTFRELLFPHIGSRPIEIITPPELLSVLRRIEVRGRLETCHRTKQRAGQAFRYAIVTGAQKSTATSSGR
jgi:Arm DNA-binding domain